MQDLFRRFLHAGLSVRDRVRAQASRHSIPVLMVVMSNRSCDNPRDGAV